MTETMSAKIGVGGRMMLAIEDLPWSLLYRGVVGYMIMPAYLRLTGDSPDSWKLVALAVGILFLLRLVPGGLRRLVPSSKEVKAVWAERRLFAKMYDSFQWRKLLGIGLGWGGWMVINGRRDTVPILLVLICVVGGALGVYFWRGHQQRLSTPVGGPRPAA